jgi:hypothetical protein
MKKIKQLFKGIDKRLLLLTAVPFFCFLGYCVYVGYCIDEGTMVRSGSNSFFYEVYSTVIYSIAWVLQFTMEFNILTVLVAVCIVSLACSLIIERTVYFIKGSNRNYQPS